MKKQLRYALLLFAMLLAPQAFAKDSPWLFSLETGALFQSKSDVQIPPETGTRFSLVDAVGNGPLPYYRLETQYAITKKHHIRLLVAPLTIEETGTLDKEVVYDGNTFAANQPTLYRYQFNSYRLSYAYRFFERADWTWDLGVTAKIRQAEITLKQGNVESRYPNLGFVPLIHLASTRQFNRNWQAQMDLDAIASPYGRAIDLGLFAIYKFSKDWQIGAGYRTVEGGADVSNVYNFAWLNYFGVKLQLEL